MVLRIENPQDLTVNFHGDLLWCFNPGISDRPVLEMCYIGTSNILFLVIMINLKNLYDAKKI